MAFSIAYKLSHFLLIQLAGYACGVVLSKTVAVNQILHFSR